MAIKAAAMAIMAAKSYLNNAKAKASQLLQWHPGKA